MGEVYDRYTYKSRGTKIPYTDKNKQLDSYTNNVSMKRYQEHTPLGSCKLDMYIV